MNHGGHGRLAASDPQQYVYGRLLLDIVRSQGAIVFQLSAGKDESLIGHGDALFDADDLLDLCHLCCRWGD